MAKHTPGPWTTSIGLKGARIHVANDANHPLSFGFNWPEMSLRGEEGAANARLIAAAPDLLAAAVELHRYATDTDYRCEREEHAEAATAGNVSYQDALLERLAFAIAKAQGS